MSKNLIVCYDGTGNEYGRNNTNVVGTFERILRDEGQIAFYDPGVGTFDALGRNLGKKLGLTLGKAFGYGLQQNIEDGYKYLMDHYHPGDKLYLFGFSRGAFTARALAGMIYHFGLLEKGSKNLIPYVSRYYLNRELESAPNFRKTYSHECKPHFIGVWDTVGSLGHFNGKKFHDTQLNEDVKFGYQAAAIDEQRKKFPISLWDESSIAEGQHIEQVWFAGVHSDVGGWYSERELSDIALGWIVDKAHACGLKVRDGWHQNLSQDPGGEIHNSRNGMWKIWKSVQRDIPEGANIHQSVFDRMKMIKDYQPVLPEKFNRVSNPSYKKALQAKANGLQMKSPQKEPETEAENEPSQKKTLKNRS